VLERLDREPVLALGWIADARRRERLDRRPRELVHRHHHCGETSGSIREWQRSHVPTEWR
jgi:hypothetical protein